MGANEKHAATYHGVQHNPDLSLVRIVYAGASPVPSYDERAEAFDRMIARVRAEAKAEALLEASKALDNDQSAEPGTMKYVHNIIYSVWLTERANQYKEEQ